MVFAIVSLAGVWLHLKADIAVAMKIPEAYNIKNRVGTER